jgi:hypothetical protein
MFPGTPLSRLTLLKFRKSLAVITGRISSTGNHAMHPISNSMGVGGGGFSMISLNEAPERGRSLSRVVHDIKGQSSQGTEESRKAGSQETKKPAARNALVAAKCFFAPHGSHSTLLSGFTAEFSPKPYDVLLRLAPFQPLCPKSTHQILPEAMVHAHWKALDSLPSSHVHDGMKRLELVK